MSTKITPKVKNKVWQDYTKNSNSKNELKQMFLGMNPTNAYKKISLKLKKKLDEVKVSSSPLRKTLRPKIKKPKNSSSSPSGPSRETTKTKRITGPKRKKNSPKRRIISPKRSSPKRSSPKRSSPKRSSPKRRSPKRRPSSPSKLKLVRSPSRRSNKDKSSSVRLIKS